MVIFSCSFYFNDDRKKNCRKDKKFRHRHKGWQKEANDILDNRCSDTV